MAETYVKGGTVLITGLRELNAKLTALDKDTTDIRDLMHTLGTIVISNARVPNDSGQLKDTLRAGRGKTKAVVRAGYARRAPYAGVVHYGNPKVGSRAQPFLTDALKQSQMKVLKALTDGIDSIIRKNNL
jgi:hypothetical protein